MHAHHAQSSTPTRLRKSLRQCLIPQSLLPSLTRVGRQCLLRHSHVLTKYSLAGITLTRLLAAAWPLSTALMAAQDSSAPPASSTVPLGQSARCDVAVRATQIILSEAQSALLEPVKRQLCRVFIAHAVMIGFQPVRDRAGPLPQLLPEVALLAALPDFFGAFISIVADVVAHAGRGPDSGEVAVADLWDGRFFTRLLLVLGGSKSNDLGLPVAAMEMIEATLANAGLPTLADEAQLVSCTAAERATYSAAIDEMQTLAAQQNAFEHDSRSLPKYASPFFDETIPEVIQQYGGASVNSEQVEEESATTVTATVKKTEDAAKAAAAAETKDDDSGPDNWDDDSGGEDDDWEKEADEEETAVNEEDAGETEVTAQVNEAAGAAPEANAAPNMDEPDVPFFEPHCTWTDTDYLPDEPDAFNTAINMRNIDEKSVDSERALNALRKFVGLLRKRTRGKVSVTELEGHYEFMIKELEESSQQSCADDLKDLYSKNKFVGLEKLIVRRWQGRMRPQRGQQSTLTAIRDYAKSLQDRVIQQEVVLEDDESMADLRGSLKGNQMACVQAIDKMKV